MLLNVIIYANGSVISEFENGDRAEEYSGNLIVLHKILYMINTEVRASVLFHKITAIRIFNATSPFSNDCREIPNNYLQYFCQNIINYEEK